MLGQVVKRPYAGDSRTADGLMFNPESEICDNVPECKSYIITN